MSGLKRVCGNISVSSIFWSDNVTIFPSKPDVNNCYQDTLFIWIPCGYLWLASVFYIPHLKLITSGQTTHIRIWSKLIPMKTLVAALLTVTSLFDLGHALVMMMVYDYCVPPSIIIKPCVLTVTIVLAAFIIHLEFKKGVQSGGVLFWYWTMLVGVYIVAFRSKLLRMTYNKEGSVVIDDVWTFSTFFVSFAFLLVEFVLSFVPDIKAMPSRTDQPEEHTPLLSDEPESPHNTTNNTQTNEPCPEDTATYLSRTTFFWISKLIVKGYRKVLTTDDM